MTACLTKEQARAPRRAASPLHLPEFDAPLLVANEPSAAVGLRLREHKVSLSSDEGIAAMVADMALNADGSRMFSPEEVPAFIEGLSVSSATALLNACVGARKLEPEGGAPVPSQPVTSAA